MIAFLTSSPTGPLDGSRQVEGLDRMNGFRDRLAGVWPKGPARCLIISAFPQDHAAGDEMVEFFRGACEKSGLPVLCFDLWDDRAENTSRETLQAYDIIFLGGGHVPTQNSFFRQLELRKKLQGYRGVVVGISAGSMNSADVVYAQPELPGEATDPGYSRFMLGLGLTKTNILPHYQMVKDNRVDGLRLFEDITLPDSYGHHFLALPDGSYLVAVGGQESIYGEAYRVENGTIFQVCENDRCIIWNTNDRA